MSYVISTRVSGYYFEVFYLEAHGLVYTLKPYATNTLLTPLASGVLIDENEGFWAQVEATAFRLCSLPPASRRLCPNHRSWTAG